jgi:diacylglycerol O-acyltransferase / wax synthase
MPSAMDLEPLRQLGQPPGDLTLTGPVGPGRSFLRTRFELDDVRQVRQAFGGTVNDVILTLAARAFRELLLRRGEVVTGRSIRALMPVAMKGGQGSAGGNRIGGVPVELPVGEVSAVECLDRIREQTSTLKALSDAMPVDAQVSAPGLGLPVLLTLGARAASTLPSAMHTVVSNVPGPRDPLYLHGHRLEGLSACISLWAPLRMAVQVMSYTGVLSFAVVADRDSVPDASWILDGATQGLRELLEAADEVAAAQEPGERGER